MILNEDRLKKLNKNCLIIDLASRPGGIDRKAAKANEIKYIWALALPGKVAPVSTAKFNKETVYNIIEKR